MLGHASVTVTLDVSLMLPTMQEEAARRLDAALGVPAKAAFNWSRGMVRGTGGFLQAMPSRKREFW